MVAAVNRYRWPYDTAIDDVRVGLRCTVRQSLAYIKEVEPEIFVGWQSANFDRGRLLGCVEIVDVSALDATLGKGHVLVRYERGEHVFPLKFELTRREMYRVCWACRGTGSYYKHRNDLRCLECEGHRARTESVWRLFHEVQWQPTGHRPSLMLDLDEAWPTVADLCEDEVSDAEV